MKVKRSLTTLSCLFVVALCLAVGPSVSVTAVYESDCRPDVSGFVAQQSGFDDTMSSSVTLAVPRNSFVDKPEITAKNNKFTVPVNISFTRETDEQVCTWFDVVTQTGTKNISISHQQFESSCTGGDDCSSLVKAGPKITYPGSGELILNPPTTYTSKKSCKIIPHKDTIYGIFWMDVLAPEEQTITNRLYSNSTSTFYESRQNVSRTVTPNWPCPPAASEAKKTTSCQACAITVEQKCKWGTPNALGFCEQQLGGSSLPCSDPKHTGPCLE